MFYGIEQSTDLRCPQTEVIKFHDEKELRKWMERSGGYTYDDPDSARNHHHTYRYGYEHIGRIDKKHPAFKAKGSGFYPMTDADRLANYLRRTASELRSE